MPSAKRPLSAGRLIVDCNAILIERPGQGGSSSPEIACRFPHSHAPYFAAALHLLQQKGEAWVTNRSLRRIERFTNTQLRQFDRWRADFNKAVEKAPQHPVGKIGCAGRGQSGPFRWECDLPVSISSDVAAALARVGTTDAVPSHSLVALKDFLTLMNAGMELFYKGHFGDAAKQFNVIRTTTFEGRSDRYQAHAGMLEYRCLRRDGREGVAGALLDKIAGHVAKLKPADPILKARVAYNRAWQDISEVNEARQLRSFQIACVHLSEAAPDDARWGYLLGIQGRLALRRYFKAPHRLRKDVKGEAQEAMDCFAHSAYLLCRAEDQWGMQEACWNIADGLFLLSQDPMRSEWRDQVSLGRSEIEGWIRLSDETIDKFNTGKDSIRNCALRARMQLIVGGASGAGMAIETLLGALKGHRVLPSDIEKRGANLFLLVELHKVVANAIEKGRVNQLLTDAYLFKDDVKEAYASYDRAEKCWKSHKPGTDELAKIYRVDRERKTIKWKLGSWSHLR